MEEELTRGRDMANHLLEVLTHKKSNTKSVLPFAEDLVREVLKSFTNTLLLLSNAESNHVAPSPLPIAVRDFSLPMNCSKQEDLDGPNCKTLNTQNQKGSYKRKRSIAPTWEKITSVLIEDGHAWRKYGQKEIMNTKYHRSYYRCTHMCDQHCQASKQVQRIQEDPPLYKTMYYGHHTCKRSFNSDLNLEPILPSDSSILLSFNNKFPNKQEFPISQPLLASTKGEPMEAIHDDHFAQNQFFSSENLLLCDFEVYFDCLGNALINEYVKSDNVYEQFGF